jgi:hypothetical protein
MTDASYTCVDCFPLRFADAYEGGTNVTPERSPKPIVFASSDIHTHPLLKTVIQKTAFFWNAKGSFVKRMNVLKYG